MISQDYLQEILTYDPETGLVHWKKKLSIRAPVGSLVNSKHNSGYIAIRINKKAYLLHRIIWLYVHGRFPEHDIDHINGDRSDNRLINLREATRSQNLHNSRPHCDSKSGIKGVSWHPRLEKWYARICVDGQKQFLGYFSTRTAAAEAYRARSEELTGEFSRCGSL